MFMILMLDGALIQRQVGGDPLGKRRNNARLRTRDSWVRKMTPLAATWKSRYFAFRHDGRWWIYDTGVTTDEPAKELLTQEAAEMWLMYRGS